MKVFVDQREYYYFVRAGIGSENFKVFYTKSFEDFKNNNRMHGVRSPMTPWRSTYEEAEKDLLDYAAKKKMIEVKEK